MTDIDYVTSLRAIAAHIKQHDLGSPSSLLSVRVDKYAGIEVHVTGTGVLAAWLPTLKDTSTIGFVYDSKNIHVEVSGQTRTGIGEQVKLTYVATRDREPDEHAALRALLPTKGDFPIELPEILLGGAR